MYLDSGYEEYLEMLPGVLMMLPLCRESFVVDTSKYILHTMETTDPLPSASQMPASPIDIPQMSLQAMPSPTRGAHASSSMPSVQRQLDYSQPQTFSDLVVGPSCLPGQEHALHVHGSAKVTETFTAKHIHVMSDERLKSNISLSEVDALSALDRVGIFQYQMSDDPDSRQQIGVIAQNLRAELPDTVELDPATGLLSVKLDKLVTYALRGVQEAAKALRDLDARQRVGMHMLMQQQSAQKASQNSKAGSFNATAIDSDIESDPDMSATDAVAVDQMDTSTPSDPASIHYTSFTDDSALVQHMMTQLGETNPGLPIKVGKLLQQLGHQATWDAFLEAQTIAILARDGTARSRGGAFLALLKKQEQAAKLRQALHPSPAMRLQCNSVITVVLIRVDSMHCVATCCCTCHSHGCQHICKGLQRTGWKVCGAVLTGLSCVCYIAVAYLASDHMYTLTVS